MSTNQVTINYLFFVPYQPNQPGSLIKPNRPKAAPYFYDVDLVFSPLDQLNSHYLKTEIAITTVTYNNHVLVADCRYTLSFPPTKATIRHKFAINTHIKNLVRHKYQLASSYLEEEYLIVSALGHHNPAAFVRENSYSLARLVRSVEERITTEETQEILTSRIAYSQNDLTIIDWEGAVILSQKADLDADVELLKIANYQLLRYRMIDQVIEEQLLTIRRQLSQSNFIGIGSSHNIKNTLKTQLLLLLEFESVDQQLLLIGDWYTSKLYRTSVREFYLDEWKAIVKTKLDQLMTIQDVYKNNLAISWSRIMDMIQLVGWGLLLFGYIVLFVLEVAK